MSYRHYLFILACFTTYLAMSSVTVYAHENHPCAPLVGNLALWNKPLAVKASQTIVNLKQTNPIPIAQTVEATLFPARSVEFLVSPQERGGSVSFAGTLKFDITKKSTYRIITNGRPWVEIVQNNKIIDSIKHQHGDKCWGMEKVLDFPLTPGHYVIELTANGKETIKFIIIPVIQ